MKRKHCRRMAALFAAVMLLSAFPAAAEQAYTTYTSEALRLSFQVDAGYSVTERDGYIWVYPGETASNFRLTWAEEGDVNKEDFFAQTGEALRAAMGGSMVYDPGTQSQPMDMRGIPMDTMMYAYTDAQSGQIIEGAYLWEQREGYSILYGAAYIPAEADAVLSGLVLASQTFSPVAEGAQEKVPEGGALSEWMAALYQDCMEIAQATAAFARSYQASVNNADTAYAAEMQAYAALCREKLEKVSACRSALEGMKGMVSGGEGAFQYENALEACRIAESLLAFYIGYYDSSDPLGAYQQKAAQGMYASEADSLNAMYIAMGDVKENYQALACPPAMTQTWPLYIRQIDAFQEKLYADYKAALLDDALMDFSATQLLMRQPYLMLRYEILMYAVIEQQFVNLANMLTLEDDTGEQQIWVDYSMAEEIYPNLYPSMDSAVNLALSTDAGKTRLLVEVEIEGFSQKYQRTVNVGPEITYLMIKPPAMSGLTSLGSGRETQITLRVTQMDTGELLVAESKTITLHSIYDFTMLNSEFGVIEPYNLLAWLRPDAEEVLALRREAIYWLETNAGAGYSSLPGYQLAYPDGTDEPSTTVLQAMAIQGAISDIGVRYNMGPYSFGGSQRVLTPDAVIQSRSGICIETALLMASALQSAQMHAMIIITPGHAQVALETWENSGTYYLLETTMLPYNATEEETMAFARYLTAEEWREYLSGDGVYVIDCDLAQTLGIRGLA